MAPEVILKDVYYNSSADWYSYGCMLYKLSIGENPFRSRVKSHDRKALDEYICNNDIVVNNTTLTQPLRDLISGLLKCQVSLNALAIIKYAYAMRVILMYFQKYYQVGK